ncbi:hypothetical protein RUND412_011691, partial [Rhizina undulata]
MIARRPGGAVLPEKRDFPSGHNDGNNLPIEEREAKNTKPKPKPKPKPKNPPSNDAESTDT